MPLLRELLAAWEIWSARDSLTITLAEAATDDRRERITETLTEVPTASALDALLGSAELVELLTN
ncbi:hypothetical protein [Actinomycetospora sp. TBRC 11914]|uniref:hypothetical protein n=1 Tax=Actinomycetospora sp. TBRC 11914 TaxID=2729387 RepID=UPI00145C8635|nr:hypothetical protein [Actinomycetospora sp. TBRC 11914]NMO90606.1 hypothetical protein [Actinomycetospora sp. TBRC 11914]